METTAKKEQAQVQKMFNRKRTNLMWPVEQRLIAFFVRHMPRFVTPNLLTAIGLLGSILVFAGFLLAGFFDLRYLLLCIVGLFVNWFGDSLDGRIAYFRNIPRKWYGFSLDIIMDWIGTVLIGLGYFLYAPRDYQIVAFLFVVLYGWAMIISQLRYKITDVYTIDAGLVGPTEIRMILALIIFVEFLFPETLHFFAAGICVVLLLINIVDTRKLLHFGDLRDARERKEREGST